MARELHLKSRELFIGWERTIYRLLRCETRSFERAAHVKGVLLYCSGVFALVPSALPPAAASACAPRPSSADASTTEPDDAAHGYKQSEAS